MLAGDGVGTAALLGAAAPTRLGTSDVWRYYLTGDFRAGTVDVTFTADAFRSELPGDAASRVGNLEDTQTFFLETITAGLGDPSLGTVQGTETLNDRGFFEVDYTKPAYAASLDVASVTDLAPEFTVTTPGVVLDTARKPVLVSTNGTTWTFRYFFTGPKNAAIAYDFIGGSVEFTNDQGERVPLFAPRRIKVVRGDGSDADTNADDLLIEVPFGELGNLDTASVAAADLLAQFEGEDATTTIALIALGESTAVPGLFRFELNPAAPVRRAHGRQRPARDLHRRLHVRRRQPRARGRRQLDARPRQHVHRDRRRPDRRHRDRPGQPRQRRHRALRAGPGPGRRRRGPRAGAARRRHDRPLLPDRRVRQGRACRSTGRRAPGSTWPATAARPATAAST